MNYQKKHILKTNKFKAAILDKFRAWFKKKYPIISMFLESINLGTSNMPKQMLIGYMIEYLYEKKLSYNLLSLPSDYCYLYLKCLIECYDDSIKKDKKK